MNNKNSINFGNGFLLGSFQFPRYKNGAKDFIFSISLIFTEALHSDHYMLHQLPSLTENRAWMKDWGPGSQITFISPFNAYKWLHQTLASFLTSPRIQQWSRNMLDPLQQWESKKGSETTKVHFINFQIRNNVYYLVLWVFRKYFINGVA